MAGLADLYAILEVPRNADEPTIKKSYRRLVLKYHPDKNPDDVEAAHQKIREINSAYETLGNPTKRYSYDAQFVACERSVKGRAAGGMDLSMMNCRASNAAIPKAFMLCPIGHPDKFLRAVGQSLFFHSREDVKHVGFDEFFAAAKFTLNWVPAQNNPDRRATLGCMCRLQTQLGVGIPGAVSGAVNTASFGLSDGISSSDIMLAQTTSEPCCNVILDASPDFPGAYRFEAAYFSGNFLAFDPPVNAQMTGLIDHFTVVDFMMTDFSASANFQLLDDVLTPVVMAFGGDAANVSLTTVCQDIRVRNYFASVMGGRFWDFNDFEIYFHAHCGKWAYDPRLQTLRLRGPQEILGLALERSKTADEVVEILTGPKGKQLRWIPLDALGHGLQLLASGGALEKRVAREVDAGKASSPEAAFRKALALLRSMCVSGEHVALSTLVPLCDALADLNLGHMSSEIGTERSDTLAVAGQCATKLVVAAKDRPISFDLEALHEFLNTPLDWNVCGPIIFQKAQKLIASQPLNELVPLLRKAARAKAGSFGEALGSAAIMKTLGASPEVALGALDAMVSGGFALEGVAMALRMLLPKIQQHLEPIVRILAGLIDRSVKGADLEACWDAISADDSLVKLSAACLKTLTSAVKRSGALHEQKLARIVRFEGGNIDVVHARERSRSRDR